MSAVHHPETQPWGWPDDIGDVGHGCHCALEASDSAYPTGTGAAGTREQHRARTPISSGVPPVPRHLWVFLVPWRCVNPRNHPAVTVCPRAALREITPRGGGGVAPVGVVRTRPPPASPLSAGGSTRRQFKNTAAPRASPERVLGALSMAPHRPRAYPVAMST